MNTTKPGFFNSPAGYTGVKTQLKPLTWNAQPFHGVAGGGVSKGSLSGKSTRKSRRRKMIQNIPRTLSAIQARSGRQSSVAIQTKRMRRLKVDPLQRAARINRRPYIPITLGGGTLVRLPRA